LTPEAQPFEGKFQTMDKRKHTKTQVKQEDYFYCLPLSESGMQTKQCKSTIQDI